ncbi:ABC transporter permease subunit [Paenibacillus sp. BK033]|uniref:ABC transporter permease n=1 Tax=unclassified Paenibacillus TaxID=185978 RepID=UPI001048BE47|nr:ABC transporter permease subunit [Paenibacillus sp. BK033]NIK67068.1 putative aldouronate transport system permease protein [Paenibacillus sp. BK720]TCN01119.1 putative aldouronate transport system permease protein [Paenibacillus sp. BK033]
MKAVLGSDSQRVNLRRKNRFVQNIKRDYLLYALLLLPMAYIAVFRYAPIYGVLMAFQDYNIFQGISGSEWVGFDVFQFIFQQDSFYRALKNTLILNLLDLAAGFPAPIILAILLNELRFTRFKKFTQTVLYLPHFLSWVIIGGMVYLMFSSGGMANTILSGLGLGKIEFLSDKTNWLIMYVAVGIWQSAGWGTILYLAAIIGINKDLYEAADMDGCSRLRKIWHITLPGIKPTIIILLILQIGRMVSIGFDRPFVMGNSLVSDYSDVISTYVYRIGIGSGDFSQATAVGLFQSVVGLIFLVSANYISRKIGEQGIW